jgi:hypothetical protein
MVSTYNNTITQYPCFCIPPIEWVAGDFPPRREVDHSPPTSAQVKKTWTYTSTPPYVFMVWCLVSQAQGQLYLLFRRDNTYCT